MDKMQPQAVELEESLIGGMINQSEIIDIASGIVTAESFYRVEHQMIFRAIVKMFEDRKPVNLLTVRHELSQRGELQLIGGAVYISKLSMKGVLASAAEYHARVIQQKYLQREVIIGTAEINQLAKNETTDVFYLIDRISKLQDRLLGGVLSGKEPKHISQVIAQEDDQYVEKLDAKLAGITPGTLTPIKKLNDKTGGWQDSDLVIIAARPAMGKSALMLCCAKSAAENNRGVAIFSLEMNSIQLVQRLLIQEAEIDSSRYKTLSLGNGELNSLVSARKKLKSLNIYLDDTSAMPIKELQIKARRLKQKHDIKLIMVDYLQLVTDPAKQMREQEISSISRGLKALAKDLNIPVIALSQLSRSTEKREDKRPQLSDLRESGAIEQDADMVMFIHRPEYYGITQDAGGNSTIGLAELIIAKHRNGDTGQVDTRWIEHLTKFDNLPGDESSNALMPNQEFLRTPHPLD